MLSRKAILYIVMYINVNKFIGVILVNFIDIIIIIAAALIVGISVKNMLGAAKHGECASCRRRSKGCDKCCCEQKSDDTHCDNCK